MLAAAKRNKEIAAIEEPLPPGFSRASLPKAITCRSSSFVAQRLPTQDVLVRARFAGNGVRGPLDSTGCSPKLRPPELWIRRHTGSCVFC